MNPFSIVGRYLFTILKAIGGQVGVKLLDFLRSFVKDQLGVLATDAVNYAEASMPGASGTEKRDAAVAKLKEDLAAAGKDVSSFSVSTLNFAVEAALQAVLASVIK